MFIIRHRAFFIFISIALVAISIAAIAAFGLRLSTDFTGGTIYEIRYTTNRPDIEMIRATLAPLSLEGLTAQPVGERGVILRLKTITNDEKLIIEKALAIDGATFTEERFSSIGPTVGKELARRGLTAIAIAVVLIILFIAFAFRGVSRPVASWKYGVIAVTALIHDVTIPTGVFALLGHFYGTEIDALFLTAALTTFGLSVNDTIVVFDRIRENLKHHLGKTFEETVGLSLNQTFVRSLITSLTVVFVLLCVYLFGGATTKNFALVLTIGMIVGTYSSIFLASPLLVVWEKRQHKA